MSRIQVPRGSTQAQVNESVFHDLKSVLGESKGLRFMDAPCGEGVFLRFLLEQFPDSTGTGVEVFRFPAHHPSAKLSYHYADLSKSFQVGEKHDVVTCISGVMEFENTSLFLETCRDHLKPGGWIVVTNDSMQMVRDRLSFLFFGKVRRFALSLMPGSPTYKCVSIQELHRILETHGFEVVKIKYTSRRAEDWLALPLALLLYPFTAILLMREKSKMSLKRRFELFPFLALLSRHYYLVARLKA